MAHQVFGQLKFADTKDDFDDEGGEGSGDDFDDATGDDDEW